MTEKKPIRLADIVANDYELAELPSGKVVKVFPVDGISYDLYLEMKADPEKAGNIWTIIARCIPEITEQEVKQLRPAECAAILTIATGKVEAVKRLAELMSGNGVAPTPTAAPDLPKSPTPSDSSASQLHES